MLLPGNWNLVIAHAAAKPNTRFNGTQMKATSKVSRIAERACESVKLAMYTPTPFRSASVKIAANGTNSTTVRNVSEPPMSRVLTQKDSSVARRNRPARSVSIKDVLGEKPPSDWFATVLIQHLDTCGHSTI